MSGYIWDEAIQSTCSGLARLARRLLTGRCTEPASGRLWKTPTRLGKGKVEGAIRNQVTCVYTGRAETNRTAPVIGNIHH
ncbi:MAG: hypothetical protein VKJ64_10325 [Leptolyngbyaceae bacterium]|nr:hypothetical protein [Leptolyngbyaceae bacterium]